MTDDNKKNFDLLISIREKHKFCFNTYLEIVNKAHKTLMSKNKKASIYGMFPVDKNWLIYDEYKGKLTNDVNEMDFKYYFDEKDRIILTERYNDRKQILEYIFYYYYEDYAEVVCYSIQKKAIDLIQYVEYKNSKLYRILELEGYVPLKNLMGYIEHIFNFNEKTVKLTKNTCAVFGQNNVSNKSNEVILSIKNK